MARRFPFFQQLDAVDCGPSCLRMVAAYHGNYYSLQQLRAASFIDQEGVSMLGIMKAAESIGLATSAFRVPFAGGEATEAGLRDFDPPFIVHWEQDHFVTVYRITDRAVWVADPAQRGLVKLSHRAFQQGWCAQGEGVGVVLLLSPTLAFYQDEALDRSRPLGFRYLWPYLRPYARLLRQLVVGLLGLSMLQLLFPFLTQAIVDIGINNQDIAFVYLILVGMLFVFLGEMVITLLQGWILLHVGTRINVSLVAYFLQQVMRLPLRYFDQKTTGDFLQRIADQQRIELFLTNTTLSALFSSFSLVVLSLVLWWYHTLIFLIFAVAAVLYAGWIAFFLKRRALVDHQRFRELTDNQNTLIELIQGMPEIKLQQSEHKRRWGWLVIQNKLFRTNTHFLTLTQYQDTGAQFISQLKDILIIFVAARAVIAGSLSLGAMLAIQLVIGQLNIPLQRLVGLIRTAQDARLSLERLGELQQLQPEEDPTGEWVTELPTAAPLRLEGVSFAYNPLAGNVLENISLTIPNGKVTALVGASGSGKTTLVKLLLGFYEPDAGTISLGVEPLHRYAKSTWRQACGAVLQDGFIFSDTIANNIAESAEEVDAQRLLFAAQMANLQDFITPLPQQFRTKIGPQGNGISQGQRQRLLIARAIYKDPVYLFFDEATNALDTENERVITENLNQFFAGRTVVVVAHRLSTVRHADQIVVLDQGQLVEQGTHEELVARQGRYFELVRNQLELGA
ncbi:MAG: ABC transporter ATP-binding protein [Bacteroidetes bacterium]|nr:MAG: ABC transporter ATP-binding protein [Bacteroidota bacterium]PTM10466.1 MAG: ABC transporter ATP-binding protein [Bacteroidota bacterium]